jgi:homeobox protein cut-like
LQSSREQLESASFALEKQKELNEKLETDLLSINKENSGRLSVDSEQDILSGLDLGKKLVGIRNTTI